MPPTTASPSVSALDTLVDLLAVRVGTARVRQLRWVAGELARYETDHPAINLARLLSPGYLNAYLEAADAGALRQRRKTGLPSPLGAQRARRVCLRMLAEAAHLPSPALAAPMGERNANWMPQADARRALSILLREARQPTARPALVRAALIGSLVHFHDLRVGEIAAIEMRDVRLPYRDEPASLTYIPDPPGGISQRAPVTLLLADQVVSMLDLWLPLRERFVAAAANTSPDGTSRTRTLLVSVHGNHENGVRRPPGLPLNAWGIQRAHARAIATLNSLLAERDGHDPAWQPLPRTLGALRPTA